MGAVREFLTKHYRHFNARETVAAAQGYEDHIKAGGKMLVSLSGAMSTAELGIILARMIREDKVHAISSTGANIEEDIFNLLNHKQYEIIHDWRGLSAEMEKDLCNRQFNRVTDTCIPEDAMRNLEELLLVRWKAASDKGEQHFHWEYIFDVIKDPELQKNFETDSANSWVFAAMQKNIPVYTPGWEDSTMGNIFTSLKMKGKLPHHNCVRTGTEQFEHVMQWYLENCNKGNSKPSVGFFQIGGGISGDFAICAVPSIIQDLEIRDAPFWGYFSQISDAVTSYGGYSGAVPNEKITWAKLDVDTPKFMIQSDASIVAPLIFAYILGD